MSFNHNQEEALVVLSGGMDSTIVLAIATKKYTKVSAISFFYGQKQAIELERAAASCKYFNVDHTIVDISFLGDLVKDVCANIKDTEIAMPKGADVKLGDQPATYVPNRNSIIFNIAAMLAEVKGIGNILTGIQVHDAYGYWDTTTGFIRALNLTLANNPAGIRIHTPFASNSKAEEIKELLSFFTEDEARGILSNTLTCYNPNEVGESCGVCPSCTERLNAFKTVGFDDPIKYVGVDHAAL